MPDRAPEAPGTEDRARVGEHTEHSSGPKVMISKCGRAPEPTQGSGWIDGSQGTWPSPCRDRKYETPPQLSEKTGLTNEANEAARATQQGHWKLKGQWQRPGEVLMENYFQLGFQTQIIPEDIFGYAAF